ncbi:MAG: NUDIX domain-containing protein [Armatimonadota bacterium]
MTATFLSSTRTHWCVSEYRNESGYITFLLKIFCNANLSYNIEAEFPLSLSERLLFRYNEIMPTYCTTTVDVLIFRREGGRTLYLVLHRAAQVRYGGQWRLIEGTVPAGETPTATAVRTVREETGLQVNNLWSLDYVHAYYNPIADCTHMNPVFATEVSVDTVVLGYEHDDSRWITYDQAHDFIRWPGLRELIRRAHDDVVTAKDSGALFRVNLNG